MVRGMEIVNPRVHILKPHSESNRFLDIRTIKLVEGFRLGQIDRFPAAKSLNGTQATKYWDKLQEQITAQGLIDEELVIFSYERELLVLPVETVKALGEARVATPADIVLNAA